MQSHSSKMNTTIVNALLLAVGVGLVSADITCPDGVVTCAKGKACCFQSGSGYSCCDKSVDDADLTTGIRSIWQPYPNQSLPSASDYNVLDYCPFTLGKRRCCHSYSPDNCEDYSECCGTTGKCCMRGFGCCSDWCCKKGYKCGPYYMSCKNEAAAQGAQGLAVMVAVALAALKFARI